MSRPRTPARGTSKSGPAPKPPTDSSHEPLFSLQQKQLDLIGLCLIALGVIIIVPMYLGARGGVVGNGIVDGAKTVFGQVGYVMPPVFIVSGFALLLAPLLPVVRPFRLGVLVVFLAVMLMLSSGTLGLAGGGRSELWDLQEMQSRGGAIGESLHWATSTLLGDIGSHVVGITLLIAGLMLLTGATVASMVRGAGDGLQQTTGVLKQVPLPSGRGRSDREDLQEVEAAEPPEQEPVVRRRGRAKAAAEAINVPTPPEADTTNNDVETGGIDIPSLTPEAPEPRITRTKPSESFDAADTDIIITPTRGSKRPSLDGAVRYPDLFGGDPIDVEDAVEAETRILASHEPVADEADDSHLPPVPALKDEDEEEFGPESSTAEPPTLVAPVARKPRSQNAANEKQAMLPFTPEGGFTLPDPALLKVSSADQLQPDTAGQRETAQSLIEALSHFNVEAELLGAVAGPHITRYELKLAPGIKMSKVGQLKDDIAYALAATDVRILAPIPGKQAVGVEVPNKRRRVVHLGDVYSDPPAGDSPLTVWLGKDVSGKAISADLSKMPHLLVAGTTGAGKSGCVNAMLSSILLHATPDQVRLVLIDPKQVELNHYDSIPHLLTPVITSPKMAANALQNLVREMEWRYGVMSVKRTRNLTELNRVRMEDGEDELPYILCVIDELADLMMVAPADVEDAIIRIAQKARAVGIHLVLATQSPRVDVITGMIKANVPSRIAFSVSSQTDSRVILDQNGAESLLGRGDMLFCPVGSSKLSRVQGAYIDEAEIALLTEHWSQQGEPELREDLLVATEDAVSEEKDTDSLDADEDPLLADAIELVVEMGAASTSGLQRRLRVGYTRAGRLVDMMERRGIVSGFEGSKARQILVSPMDLPGILSALRGANEHEVQSGEHDPVDDHTGEHLTVGNG